MYKSIPHHCIDFVHPRKTFTVADFKRDAKRIIEEIHSRGNLPILAGGTGFYTDTVLYDTTIPEVPPNKKLRSELEKKSVAELYKILKKLDIRRATNIDKNNPRRLIRAIEIIRATKKPMPLFSQTPAYNALIMGIRSKDIVLQKSIGKRSREQIRAGLLREVQKLLTLRVSKKRIREFGFEYRLALAYLEAELPSQLGRPPACRPGRVSKLELADMLTKENWQYAKRQMTWFKKNKNIVWISNRKEAEKLVKTFLS